MKRLILFFFIFTLMLNAIGQPRHKTSKEKWEKYRSEKISFLTSKLDLSPDEAQKFWPVYNQLEKERWKAQKTRREIEGKVREAEGIMSDENIKQLTRQFAGSLREEADLQVNYNEKFLEILPPRKVLILYKTENEFRMFMIKKYRDKHHNKE